MKIRHFLVLAMIVCLTSAGAADTLDKKFNITIGGAGFLSQVGYDFTLSIPYEGETAYLGEMLEKSTMIGFTAGAGFFVTPNIEIVGRFFSFSKSLTGEWWMSIPSMFYYNDSAEDSIATSQKIKQSIINLGANYHFITGGSFDPYIGAGVSFLNTKMDLVSEIYSDDEYDAYLNYYVTIFDYDLETTKLNKTAFYASGGFNYNLNRLISIYAEALYILGGKVTFDHPFWSEYGLDPWEFNLGGLVAGAGIKISL